jgi:hypothetical protein
MKHFLQYQSPDRLIEQKHVPGKGVFWIITRKKLNDLIGNCIWLIEGDGVPRSYFLKQVFIAEQVEIIEDEYFYFRITGRNGRLFQPLIELTNYPWFKDMKLHLGNFSLGLSGLRSEYYEELIQIARIRFQDFFETSLD